MYDNYIPKDSFRLHVYKKFYSLFPNTEQFKKISINIERSIFNYSIILLRMNDKLLDNLFKFTYTNKATVIYRNLDRNNSLKNNYLYDKIVSLEIDPKDLVYFSPEQMFPKRYAEIALKYYDEKRSIEEIMTATVVIPEDYVGEHKCRRCKSWRTTYEMIQNRAGDESSSIHVTCFCGYKWKYNP